MQLLTAMFQDRIIYRNSDFEPRTIRELKVNIRQEILSLHLQILRSVMENNLKRAQVCEAKNGGYVRDLIFRN